ncbi:MAG TPA: methyltransferase domain-containing protein [Puia sp.]|nr:methyltransferase domain-containing protein [Puia sp.]
MKKKKILFISHKKKQCGVYEFGKHIFNALSSSEKYDFIRAECSSLIELKSAAELHTPEIIIFNYHPSVMPWVCTKSVKGLYKNNINNFSSTLIGIIHEVNQNIANKATNYRNKYILGDSSKRLHALFDFYIAPDPTLLLKNPIVYKTGRLIPEYNGEIIEPKIPTFGSFGFGTPNKGFQKVVEKVKQEFDKAIIRLNISFADFGDKDGINARKIAQECIDIVKGSNIQLEITHDFFDDESMLKFLAANSMNVFLYKEDTKNRGISSAIDNALAVKKPVAVSRSSMFRHILNTKPSICADDLPLQTIFSNGFLPLEKITGEWNKENLIWEYERIIGSILNYKHRNIKEASRLTLVQKIRKLLTLPQKKFTWLRSTEEITEDDLNINNKIIYEEINIPKNIPLNRILDNKARELYKPAINKLFEIVPKTMSKKIAEANVQQGFVFNTTYHYISKFKSPRILCIGSYEDTAAMSLKKMGFQIDEIDPMINYYLQEYCTKPSVEKNSYDIIFSTSVIEHDPDDKSFMEAIDLLLKPKGVAIITCDYNDQWKPGDPKPEVDARFYTKKDLEERLLSYLPSCELVDTPEWDCPNPDFCYLGKFQYTFATFVIRKKDN